MARFALRKSGPAGDAALLFGRSVARKASEKAGALKEAAVAKGRQLAGAVKTKAGELKRAAIAKGRSLVNRAKGRLAEARKTVAETRRKIGEAVSAGRQRVKRFFGLSDEAAETTSRGPGVFKPVNESMSGRAAAYQSQISGQPAGQAYEVRGVKFDGFESGTLLEAKGPGFSNFVKDNEFIELFRGAEKMISQATQQLRAAGATRVEWHVAEEGTAKAIRNLFKDEGIKGINVIHTPAG